MAFGPVARLPVTLSAHLLPPDLHEPFVRFLVKSGSRVRGGAFLAASMLRGGGAGGRAGRPVLIGGPARVGKSTTAKRLAGGLGYRVLNTDDLYGWYPLLPGHRELQEFREGWVGHLLGNRRVGVVVEGALLVMEGRHDLPDARISLGAFNRWCRTHDVVAFTVGSAAGSRIDRLRAVEGKLATCWTAGYSRRARWDVVRRVTHRSTLLRKEAARHGVAYREISPLSFHADIAGVVAEAEAAVLGEEGVPPASPAPGEGALDRVPPADAPREEREEG